MKFDYAVADNAAMPHIDVYSVATGRGVAWVRLDEVDKEVATRAVEAMVAILNGEGDPGDFDRLCQAKRAGRAL